MAGVGSDADACGNAPKFESAIATATGESLTIVAKDHRPNSVKVPGERFKTTACPTIPQLNGVVIATTG